MLILYLLFNALLISSLVIVLVYISPWEFPRPAPKGVPQLKSNQDLWPWDGKVINTIGYYLGIDHPSIATLCKHFNSHASSLFPVYQRDKKKERKQFTALGIGFTHWQMSLAFRIGVHEYLFHEHFFSEVARKGLWPLVIESSDKFHRIVIDLICYEDLETRGHMSLKDLWTTSWPGDTMTWDRYQVYEPQGQVPSDRRTVLILIDSSLASSMVEERHPSYFSYRSHGSTHRKVSRLQDGENIRIKGLPVLTRDYPETELKTLSFHVLFQSRGGKVYSRTKLSYPLGVGREGMYYNMRVQDHPLQDDSVSDYRRQVLGYGFIRESPTHTPYQG